MNGQKSKWYWVFLKFENNQAKQTLNLYLRRYQHFLLLCAYLYTCGLLIIVNYYHKAIDLHFALDCNKHLVLKKNTQNTSNTKIHFSLYYICLFIFRSKMLNSTGYMKYLCSKSHGIILPIFIMGKYNANEKSLILFHIYNLNFIL